MKRLLWRCNQRFIWQHPWQMLLALLGIVLGVAVVVAVDLANQSVSRAFLLSMDEVSGRATHQIIGGPTGLDEQLYTRLRVGAGIREVAPVIEAFAEVGDHTLRLLGIDPFAENNFRGHLNRGSNRGLRRLLSEPDAVLMAPATAVRLGLKKGQRFTVKLAGRSSELILVGLLNTQRRAAAALDGFILADIATVQELTGTFGLLSWIDLILPQDQEQVLRESIARLLPQQATLVPAASRSNAMSEMVKAGQTNLSAMSLLALIVGLFLRYNTMTFTVLQRRTLIGTLRALGVTRREVFATVLGEAVVIGLIGVGLGTIAGMWLAQGLIQLVVRTINELYFVSAVSQVQILWGSLLKGLVLGLGATLLAALVPALEAIWTNPNEALKRSVIETKARLLAPWLAWSGLGLGTLGSLILMLPTQQLTVGFAALFMMILGMTLIAPLMVSFIVRLAAPQLGWFFGLQARLSVRGIDLALSRTGVAIAALMLAVSTTVGVGVMIQSFRGAVDIWLETVLQADVYISSPGLMATRTQSRLDPELLDQVKDVSVVDHVTTGRTVTVESERGLIRVFALDTAGHLPHYRLKEGDPALVWETFLQDWAVVVSEPLAYVLGIKVGDHIELRTDRGPRRFAVAGIYFNYSTGPGLVLMNRGLYEQHWHDRDVGALGVYLKAGVDSAEAMQAIRERIDVQGALSISSNREIREASMQVFDRTFAITNVLRLLVVLVAFVGVFSALMALQLERAREFAVLRATGVTVAQTWRMVILQSGFMGFCAGLLSLPVGLALSLLLIHVINRRAFGWSMSLQLDPQVLIQALALAVSAALLAGLYPAWRMARASPAVALRQE